MHWEQKERGLLVKLGLFLCRDGQVPEAETIFSGLAASEPERDGPAAGLALCWIIKGQFDNAIALLDSRLSRGHSPIAASLSMYKLAALGMAGRLDEAKKLAGSIEKADKLLADLESMGSGSMP